MFNFLLKVDVLSYITLTRTKIGILNDEPFRNKPKHEDSYYIPPDWHSLVVRNDVGDFAKKGDNWYNTLIRYTELGHALAKEFPNMPINYYNPKRAKELSHLFKGLRGVK